MKNNMLSEDEVGNDIFNVLFTSFAIVTVLYWVSSGSFRILLRKISLYVKNISSTETGVPSDRINPLLRLML